MTPCHTKLKDYCRRYGKKTKNPKSRRNQCHLYHDRIIAHMNSWWLYDLHETYMRSGQSTSQHGVGKDS